MSDEARLLDNIDEEELDASPNFRQVRDHAKKLEKDLQRERQRREQEASKAQQEHETALETERKAREEAEQRVQALETKAQEGDARAKLEGSGIAPTAKIVRDFLADGQPEDVTKWLAESYGSVVAPKGAEPAPEEPERPTFPPPTTLGTPPPSQPKISYGDWVAMRQNPQTHQKAMELKAAGLVIEEPWTGRPG